MTDNALKIAYTKMKSEVPNAHMYDGRNKGIDIYECSNCGEELLTMYADKGVTPFTIPCILCNGTMKHIKTVQGDPGTRRVLKWYRPSLEETLEINKRTPWMIDHILNKGLILEKL